MIDYKKISQAIDFYKNHGYEYIDVPWSIEEKYIDQTIPLGTEKYKVQGNFLVGSAEQSFIQLQNKGSLKENEYYVACTPCFRDEKFLDELHQPYFMKVELFYSGSYDRYSAFIKILNDAYTFFRTYVTNEKHITISYGGSNYREKDIFINNIEVGSYYFRDNYVCGTGIAEPRLSYALLQKDIE